MKYLVIGLGNIGAEFDFTRHNIGFDVLDALAKEHEVEFQQGKYAFYCGLRIKGRSIVLLKPTTFMNLSGKAVKYWCQKEKVPLERTLVVTDDINIPLGKLRLKGKGSHGGHNGLRNIEELMGSREYPRLRVGAGGDFPRGRQVEFVLSQWAEGEKEEVKILIEECKDLIESFVFRGLNQTMNQYNR